MKLALPPCRCMPPPTSAVVAVYIHVRTDKSNCFPCGTIANASCPRCWEPLNLSDTDGLIVQFDHTIIVTLKKKIKADLMITVLDNETLASFNGQLPCLIYMFEINGTQWL